MPYRKVGCLEQLWYLLRGKLRRIFRRKKYVYDFHRLTEYEDLESVLHMINEQGWQLVCVAPHEGDLAVFFRRPA